MEERHWIQAIIPNATLDDVFVYTGCSGCGKKCSVPEGRQFTCIVCDDKNCVSSPRVAFKFEAVDITGSITLTSFNNHTEKLFSKSAAEIKTMKDLGDVVAFQEIEEKLRKKTTFFKLGPSNSLGSSSVLEWSLKNIETAEDASKKDLTKLTVAGTDEFEFSDLNMNVNFTNKETPDSKTKDKGKGKISETNFDKFPLTSKGVVIADESHRVADSSLKNKSLKHSATHTPALVKTPKISPTEWTQLCRTRITGNKQSHVSPAHSEDTQTNLVCVQSVGRKKLRLTPSASQENEEHESAKKDPQHESAMKDPQHESAKKDPANLAPSAASDKPATPEFDANTSTPGNDQMTQASIDSLTQGN
ncbi:uncharacterized protein LOC110729379 [Chenopodium quinoa]|uniref:uncharacterized protein LOC110729379 n=1 Tax=Chenopodium quinoa TaxID=63459 RepID=UPI000B7954BA|nr:uncharacterized protein LOC110729379 [Chenopodium quinoa]